MWNELSSKRGELSKNVGRIVFAASCTDFDLL